MNCSPILLALAPSYDGPSDNNFDLTDRKQSFFFGTCKGKYLLQVRSESEKNRVSPSYGMHDYIHSRSNIDLRFIHTTKNELHRFVDQSDVAQGISFALKKTDMMP